MLSRVEAWIGEGIEQGLHTGAQLCVSREGQTVAALAVGEASPGHAMTDQSIALWMSSGKPVTAVAITQLVEQGEIEWDDPVAAFLPGFAAHGKGDITVRHLLTHTAGIRTARFKFPRDDWDTIIAAICDTQPEWAAGQGAGYHVQTSWFILGELVRLVDGRTIDTYVREEVFLPLGMLDSWLGMPTDVYERYEAAGRLLAMPSTATSEIRASGLTGPDWSTRPRPGGNCMGPISELVRFYEMLLAGGVSGEGERLLQAETVELMTGRRRTEMLDQTFKSVVDWGLGFVINSAHHAPGGDAGLVPYGYGDHASRETFGHGGAQSSVGFADPDHGLAVGVVFNGMPGEIGHQRRMHALLTALYEDLGLA
ncbi:MAG: serine hydrolase domain-containing protein [Planctomycetota bacterium]